MLHPPTPTPGLPNDEAPAKEAPLQEPTTRYHGNPADYITAGLPPGYHHKVPLQGVCASKVKVKMSLKQADARIYDTGSSLDLDS